MLERDFQVRLIKRLEILFPGCLVLKNDPTYLQGFPDLIILFKDRWAVLECKKSINEDYQPNQRYYLAKTKIMSYSATIYPENMEEILNELQQALRA